jgi:hypothetical protein
MLVGQATSEQRAAIVEFLRDGRAGALRSGSGRARFLFRRAGSYWDVVFEGGRPFHLKGNLGARYLDYLLHHPNKVISAFDLEIAVQPEKAGAREQNSIQKAVDPDATRAYLRELTRLRIEREEAAQRGEAVEVDRLDEEIGALEEALQGGGVTGDAGERARGNVSKAVAGVRRELVKGGQIEFVRHIEQFVSTGYECVYHQPPGRVWE